MRRSRSFLPLLKETPAEAQIVSHRLMLRGGLVRQTSAGIYAWLPLGYRVLRNIERIIEEEQARFGAVQMLMPTIQSAELWRQSGRYDDYGKEMLRIIDRQDREMLYGPTNEEMITDIFASFAKSYKDLPTILFHIQWKFRDEIRPRFGVMRGREFLMKDGYSFDLDKAAARRSYNRMMAAYLATFRRLGLKAVPVQADTGPIGGDLSHEFHILAETGESALYADKALFESDLLDRNPGPEGDIDGFVAEVMGHYTAADERHDAAKCPVPSERLAERRGIEVGHIFYFGTKYSAAMGLKLQGPEGQMIVPEMGSYGIGVSRLVAAIIEANHDDAGMIWPESVAPFKVGLITLKAGDAASDAVANDLYAKLESAGVSVLIDDTGDSPGAKFAAMDLIGLPWQIIIGPRGLAKGTVEVKRRATGERQELSPEAAFNLVTGR
jgi:prolyl-tRNA synthetase